MVDTMTYNGVVYHGFQAVELGFLSGILAYVRVIFKQNKTIIANQTIMILQEKQTMSTIADLNAAVAQEQVDVVDVATKIAALAAADNKAFADLEAELAAGASGTAITAAVTQLAANHAALTNASDILVAQLTATQAADSVTGSIGS